MGYGRTRKISRSRANLLPRCRYCCVFEDMMCSKATSADAALLVYDITDAESFQKVQKWVKELRKIVGQEIQIAIAGNKVDLQKNRNVTEEEASRYEWVMLSKLPEKLTVSIFLM